MECIAPGVWRLRIGAPESITPVSVREEPIRAEALAAMAEATTPPFPAEAVQSHVTARGLVLHLPLAPEERIFGLGLQLQSHDQTTLKKTLRTNSDPVADTGDSHAPVPFYLSTAGYGVLVDTARYAAFYCGSHQPTAIPKQRPEHADELADNEENLYRRDKRPRGPMVVDIPVAEGVDVYLFAGPGMGEALRRYVLFSGGGALPPLWGLGVWYRCYVNHTQDEALALAEDLRESDVPCDVFGLEPGWHAHAYACNHKWHPQRWPEPKRFLEAMAAMDFKVNLWEHVFLDDSSELYEAMSDKAGDFRVWGGLVPDLLDREARALFEDHHEAAFLQAGVRGFKLDECDNSDYVVYPWSFPEHSQFPSGADGEQMHSLFGLGFQRMIQKIYRRHGLRTLGQVRSSHALAAPYPFVLYSDLYDHAAFIRGVVNAGLSGLLWSPEVRQCASVEDMIRRVQTVVFSPQALVNGWMIRNAPWKQVLKEKNNEGEFMEGWEEAQAAVAEVFRWRMRLLPYLYAAFHRYWSEGVVPFRALVVDCPEDAETHAVDDQYMMGPDVLVAPVLAGQSEREVYLPAGTWYHFWTHERIEGGRHVTVAAPLDQIPAFVRDGAILPLAEPVPCVKPDTTFALTVHTYGEACRPLTLLEDDGESFAVEEGKRALLTLGYSQADGPTATRAGAFDRERYTIAAWAHHE